MSKNQDLNKLVRQRQAKTGESFSIARLQVLAKRPANGVGGRTIGATMGRPSKKDERTGLLFEMPPPSPVEPEVKRPRHPIWTENKAKLIQRYLHYFVMVTHHGTYIDGFAGPQDDGKHDMWSAKLVLEHEPRWLRQFYLFDKNRKQVEHLEQLRDAQPPMPKGLKREVKVTRGDFNVEIEKLLAGRPIKDKEATFCLLDQRTFECKWKTLHVLAAYKPQGFHKIELFYFLPNHWLDRSVAALTKNVHRGADWWGRDDWSTLQGMSGVDRAALFATRFKKELGYASAKAYPIMERANGGSVMYYMIHATDHPAAPALMARAYAKAVTPLEPVEQLSLEALLKPVDE
jgi:three-Cys-motif partner protein